MNQLHDELLTVSEDHLCYPLLPQTSHLHDMLVCLEERDAEGECIERQSQHTRDNIGWNIIIDMNVCGRDVDGVHVHLSCRTRCSKYRVWEDMQAVTMVELPLKQLRVVPSRGCRPTSRERDKLGSFC